MTRNRDIAKFLGKTETSNTVNSRLIAEGQDVGLDSAEITTIATGKGLQSFTTLDSLPVTNLTAGDQAFVESDQRLYISNGNGWYNVALINSTPFWDSAPLSSYTITDSATPLIIIAKARDSDNSDINLLHQSTVSDSAAFLVDITRDSSVYTFTPKSQDSIGASATAGNLTDSNTNDFIYTFKWSDGINFVTKAVTINYNFITDVFISATGGTITTSGDYKYHAFTSTGNTNFVVSSIGVGDGEAIEYLIVAGGGGGGWESTYGAGGGGAGGVIHHAGWTGLSAQTYVMSVGAGGASRTKGTNSTAFGNTAIGGGPGASAFSTNARTQNLDGGSGGGGGVDSGVARRGAAEAQTTISGATAYGNRGSNNNTNSPYYPGAGGGAGGAAGDAYTNASADGGAGRLFSNFTSFGVSGYFAGGGGGGTPTVYGGTDTGAGGSGGGGTGGDAAGGTNGTTNTGGGAGGGNNSGGSGIIIVRYKYQ